MDFKVGRQALASARGEEEAPSPRQRAQCSKTESVQSIKPMHVFLEKSKWKGKAVSLPETKKEYVEPLPEEVKENVVVSVHASNAEDKG